VQSVLILIEETGAIAAYGGVGLALGGGTFNPLPLLRAGVRWGCWERWRGENSVAFASWRMADRDVSLP